MAEQQIGTVEDYFAHISVAAIDLTGTLKVGDRIHIQGHTTDMEVPIDSMEIDRHKVTEAKAGQSVGVKVPDRVRKGDHVFKAIE